MGDEPFQADAYEGQSEPTSPTPQTTNIEALQALKATEGNRAATEQALRQLLSVLDPNPTDHALAFRDVLARLEQVMARERNNLEDK